MASRIRLLALDIDGTLLSPAFEVSQRDLSAVLRARAHGVEVILVTGRRHTFAMEIAALLGFDLWMITSNGAVTRSTAGESFHRELLSRGDARRLIAHMEDYRHQAVITFDKDHKGALVLESYSGVADSIGRWLDRNSQFVDFVVPLEACLSEDPIQLMFCGTIPQMAQAERQLMLLNARYTGFTILKTVYPVRDLCLLDVLNGNCSKGKTLARWARHRGLEPSEVMAIGDNYNDIEMLEYVGCPVIMGNASEELKGRGWAETLGNHQHGVAAAVEKYILDANN